MLVDGFGRNVTYLRVSVTERCNFRCQYCMPEKPFSWVPKENLLSFEELFLFVKVAIDEGITKIRITGGEPLLRTDLDKFIAMINQHKSGLDLALTTNGFLLKDAAQKLKNAGLQRVNISLDSLKPEVASKMAQKDVLAKVQAGIEEALRVGLNVKINMVPIKGINADEVLDVLEYAKARGMSIRFIEYMENTHAKEQLKGLSGNEVQAMIAQRYPFKGIGRVGPSPAHLFELDDGYVFGHYRPTQTRFL